MALSTAAIAIFQYSKQWIFDYCNLIFSCMCPCENAIIIVCREELGRKFFTNIKIISTVVDIIFVDAS